MKLLWAACGFLHPTTRGGQIRTLKMLEELHRRHQVHYAALADPHHPEGVRRAAGYAARVLPFEYQPAPKGSARFALEVALGTVSSLPLAVGRWQCAAMQSGLRTAIAQEAYDACVCDFLATAVNFPDLHKAVLFEHNVETVLWKRHAEAAADPLRRFYFRLQARRMRVFEGDACRRAAQVVAVSQQDAATLAESFGVPAHAVPTGVDTEYFRPPEPRAGQGLVFVGSMDWMPNIDGIQWFAREVLPRIRERRRDLPVTIVGRTPPASIRALADADPFVRVTGTVDDVRPYLWRAAASVVPLRVGGGTRLKIYESLAAGTPVISTTIGAEGLEVRDGETVALADAPEEFARRCLEYAGDPGLRRRMSLAGLELVTSKYSWAHAARAFEQILEQAREPAAR